MVTCAAIYRRIVVCSPFIDEYGKELVDRLYRATTDSDSKVQLVSTPMAVAGCELRWPGRVGFEVIKCPGLHAKLYVAIGHRPADHMAIVTSANLTAAGLTQNVECGLRITGSTRMLAALVERIPVRVGLHNQMART